MEGVWDRTDFIRNRFNKIGYKIPENWTYTIRRRNTVDLPIPVKYKNKWHRLTWDNFNSGMRVDIENYFYFVTLKVNGIECLKLGVTRHDLKKRYGSILQKVHCMTERRAEPQTAEVENLLLTITKKYSILNLIPDDFSGRSECRSMDMDIPKTIKKIQSVFKTIDKKWESLPEIVY